MNKIRTNCEREKNLRTLKGMKILEIKKKHYPGSLKKHKLNEPKDMIIFLK